MEHMCQNPSPAPQKPAPALPQKAAPKAAPSDMRHFPPSPWLGAEEHTRTMSQTEPNQTFIHPGQQVPRRSRPQVSQTREQQQQKPAPLPHPRVPLATKPGLEVALTSLPAMLKTNVLWERWKASCNQTLHRNAHV